ncbi:MAG: hypothetical protein PHN44_01170 [Candidatus Marinimicrobia bacterium]|nr:hypothetical protein [Candidatus Neomarinimicrobiota bacterium]MDD5539096.1 hypothetical protein [Candidatus Neomarinimicrobiota bacterium]
MENTEKKCWACGGIMSLQTDHRGFSFFRCKNEFCGATDTGIAERKLGTPSLAAPATVDGKKSGRMSDTPRPIRKKKEVTK